MGRKNNRGRGGSRGGRGGRGRGGSSNGNGTGAARVDMRGWGAPVEEMQHNDVFEAYYLDQGIMDYAEWSTFLDHMRAPLPTSFRFAAGKPVTKVLLQQMRDFYLPFLSNVEFEGQPIPPPKALPWYPEGMAWQIDVKKNALRKTDQFKKFQHFLVHETEVGNISRQETVSMIPPVFLDVKPHHIVLDMCAAPGSKTAQLIEALHSPLTTASESYDPCPPGLVIANDSDAKRAHMLVHQSSRLPSPNILVANCDAARWPAIKVPWAAEGSDKVAEKTLKYDRILADVPCSGDGTLRKNLMIWTQWVPQNGAALHALQLRILMRGVANLRNGGRIVYSTCSLNPLENEAVVAAALRECNGTLRLVDQSDAFAGLKRRRGLTTWKVLPSRGKQKYAKKASNVEDAGDESGEASSSARPADDYAAYRGKLPDLPWADKWEDVEDEFRDKCPKSLWPNGDEEALGLQHCMRVLPQDQNTGGFFIAVLEKHDDKEAKDDEGMALGMQRAMALKAKQTSSATSNGKKRELSPEVQDVDSSAKRLKGQDGEVEEAIDTPPAQGANGSASRTTSALNEDIGLPGGTPFREDPMVFVDIDNEQSKRIISFFGLTKEFDPHNILVRNRDGSPLRSIYIVSTSARALISSGGPGKGGHPYGNPLRMRLINCGVRAFARQDSGKDAALQCKWRVTADAVPALRPLVEPIKILQGTLGDFAFLTANHYPKLNDMPENDLRKALESAEMGSHLLDITAGTWKEHTMTQPLCVPIWRAAASVNLMLDRQEKSALSYRIFGSDLSNPSGDRQFSQSRAQVQAQQALSLKKRGKGDGEVAEGEAAEPAMKIDDEELEALENSAAAAEAVARAAATRVSELGDAQASTEDAAAHEDVETKALVSEEGQDLPSEEAAAAVEDGITAAAAEGGPAPAPGA